MSSEVQIAVQEFEEKVKNFFENFDYNSALKVTDGFVFQIPGLGGNWIQIVLDLAQEYYSEKFKDQYKIIVLSENSTFCVFQNPL